MKAKRKVSYCRELLLLMVLVLNTLTAGEPAWTEVGTAKVDITPKEPVRLTGYGERKVEFEGIEQRLWARAIAIGAKDDACVLVSVDNCGITADIVEQVAARLAKTSGLPRERLVVCSTHTHTAPAVTRFAPIILSNLTDEQQTRIDAYTKWVTEQIGDAAISALNSRRPARLTWSEGNLAFTGNRRVLKNGVWTGFGINVEGPVQQRLPALRAVDKEDKLIALVANYACHCTTLGGGFNKVCGDWAGYAAEYLEADHAGATTLITIGCGADANPNPRGKLEMAQAHGRAFAIEVERLLKLPWRELPVKVEARLVQAQLPLAEAPPKQHFQTTADDPKQSDSVRRHARAWLARLERNEKPPEHVSLPVASWSFGESLSMLFLGGEVVVDYDTLIRERFDPARLWISAYSNDVPCYIPSQRILKEGGYEAKQSMIYYDKPGAFAPEVESVVLDAVKKVMPKAFEKAALNPDEVKSPKSAGPNTPPPLTPEEALKSFRLKPGFRVELAACEPLVESPVCFDWGPDGRLWVVEMRDYPTGLDGKGKPGGRVKVLTDVDNDGRYDEAKIFLDELACPSAIKVWRDGAMVIATTEIIFARDIDGDGKADKIDVLFDGLKKGNQQHLANSLSFRLDGGLQVANGDSGGKLRSLKTGQSLEMRGRDLSIMPDTGIIEARSGQTQFGTSRDDWDNWFGGNNSYPMWHYALDDRYISRNPHLPAPDPRVHVSVDPGASRVYPASQITARFNDHDKANRFTSACSPIVYRDTLLQGLAGDAFICEPVHNLVHREVMSAKGETFSSQRAGDEAQSEFFASTDTWCRPVNIRTGPDGALWVADMYRYVIEHPQWIPHEWQRQLNLRAGETCGRIYRIVPEKNAPKTVPRLDKLEMSALVQSMNTPNGTVRDLIHQMLIWKPDPAAIAPLRELAKSAELPQTRVQALWVLDCLQAAQENNLLAALTDKHPAVRRHAIRLSENLLMNSDKMLKAVLALESDEDFQVQMQLAYSLGMTNRIDAGRALGRMATRHAGRPYLLTAITSSALPHLESVMDEVLSKPESLGQQSLLVNQLIGMAVATDEYKVIARVLTAAASANAQAAWKFGLLATFYEALNKRGASVAAFLQKTPVLLERRTDLESALAAARTLVLDSTAALETRVLTARLLGREPAMLKADLEALTTLMTSATEPELLLEAVSALNRLQDPKAHELLFTNWNNRTPALRRAVIDSLLTRPVTINILFDRIAKLPSLAAAIDTSRRQRLLSHSDNSIRLRASKLFTVNLESDRAKVVAQHENVLRLHGDAKRGKDVFSTVCASCHRLEDAGKNVGPDLTALNDKSPPAMLTAILDPNRAVEDRYVQYVVATNDGVTLVGKIESETASGITLLGVDGEPKQLLRRDIRSIKSTNLSLMPEGLEQTLDDQKLADVIAYLSHVCSPPKKVAGNQPQTIAPDPDGTLMLLAENAEIYGRRLIFESQFRNLGFWEGLDDHARWSIRIDKPGRYAVEIEYSCADANAGNRLVVAADRVDLKTTTVATGGWEKFAKRSVGWLDLRKGFHRVVVRADGKLNGSLMDLRAIRLALSNDQAAFRTITPETDGSLSLKATAARAIGPKIKYMPEWQAFGWFTGEDSVEWDVQIAQAGKYDVILEGSVSDQDAGKHFRFEIAGSKLIGDVKPTGGWENFANINIGRIELQPGKHKAVFAPAEAFPKGALLDLREIRLVPAP
jgi:putative membrane-bound dehydrogenase-like protein